MRSLPRRHSFDLSRNLSSLVPFGEKRLRDEPKEHLYATEAFNCVIFFCVTSISIYIVVTGVLDLAREQALFFGKRFSMQVSFKPSVPQISNINVV